MGRNKAKAFISCRRCHTTYPRHHFEISRGRPGMVCLTCRTDDPYLPGGPLVDAIHRFAHRQQESPEEIYRLLEITPRTVYHWRQDSQRPLSSEVDRILMIIDRFYWDVYDENTVRKPLLVVREYKQRRKIARDGQAVWRSWELVRMRGYGDGGPDRETLEVVRRSFEGAEAVAA